MAIPPPGPWSTSISMGDVRTELGLSGTNNFSLTNASNGTGGYPAINIYSYFKPNRFPTSTFMSLNSWKGYNHTVNRYFYFVNTGATLLVRYLGPNQSFISSIPNPVAFTINITIQLPTGPLNLPSYSDFFSPSQYNSFFGYIRNFQNIYSGATNVTVNSFPTYVQMQPFGSSYPTPYIGSTTFLP